MGSHIVFSSETRLADARELTIAKGLTLEEWPSNDGPIFTQVENYFYLQSVGPGIEVCEKNDVAFYAIFLVTKVTKMTKVEVSASHYLGLLECHTQGIHLISQSPGPASTLRASPSRTVGIVLLLRSSSLLHPPNWTGNYSKQGLHETL